MTPGWRDLNMRISLHWKKTVIYDICIRKSLNLEFFLFQITWEYNNYYWEHIWSRFQQWRQHSCYYKWSVQGFSRQMWYVLFWNSLISNLLPFTDQFCKLWRGWRHIPEKVSFLRKAMLSSMRHMALLGSQGGFHGSSTKFTSFCL